MFDSCLAKYFA